MDNNCIFCKIISGTISAQKLYEDEDCFIIKDIDPKAEKHFLLIPKVHYKLLENICEIESQVFGRIFSKMNKFVEILGLQGGFRLVINQGDAAGQSVPHLHIHILKSEKMGWTPA